MNGNNEEPIPPISDSDYVASLKPIVDFLGVALGPTVEIVLHDVTTLDASVIAITNGHVSGREIGSPATDLLLRILRSGEAEQRDYITGYTALSSTGTSNLRSSTYFIRREKRIVGALCINADQTLLKSLESLTNRISASYFTTDASQPKDEEDKPEVLSTSIADITSSAIHSALATRSVDVDHYSTEDRLAVVKLLDDDGYFQLKGSVADLANALEISEPSIYRYLRQVRGQN
ncbi:PAS domain-containing protein [Corynebacterium pyruviciproducens]|uniref:helix-turn-helix transcriptional regulator n=1 Tax=Corynebacterium pyruviciproducens TaxID=598660 RepID=UPI002550DEE2|nr:PAS domain-containing protein [Corynebacterium pyruviciproducens]MDK6565555.1 PAS domain-containing protein [Corynebacterium pyruviciproducens]